MSKKKWAWLLMGAGLLALAVFLYEAGRLGKMRIIEESQSIKEKQILEETAIDYQVVYNLKVDSKEKAMGAIKEEGRRQRDKYDNPDVKLIELKMEEEFGILAVNLGEISEETAWAVYEGFAYMYQTYPCLQDSLTNLTLGNMGNLTGGTVAMTDRMAFLVNGSPGNYPFVEKYMIVLNAREFLNEDKLNRVCERLSRSGYWPEGANISSLMVHELGHQLQNVVAWKEFGLKDPYYITAENGDAFGLFHTDRLSSTDNLTVKILEEAYEIWQQEYGKEGSYEDFVFSISRYAMGGEMSLDYLPSETFAEAFTDIYLNGEEAADASKAVRDAVIPYLP